MDTCYSWYLSEYDHVVSVLKVESRSSVEQCVQMGDADGDRWNEGNRRVGGVRNKHECAPEVRVVGSFWG